ncbi:MAG: hypothetical protein P4L76_15360 [Beijerinckiaceae bacterium]|nr:hypothetical protein [Beijerinckiaceae bacterium]
MPSRIVIQAVALLATFSIANAQEKSLVEKNSQWYYDEAGNIDSCKVGIPSPFANVRPDDRIEFDKGVEACHQKKVAQAQDAIKRQHDMAAQRANERLAALQLAQAHKRYLDDHHLTEVSVVDIQANGKDMVGGHISVTGYVRVFNEDRIAIYTNPDDINGVRLDVSGASSKSRRLIFGQCSNLYDTCKLEIIGAIGFDDHVLVQVE